MVQFTCVPAGPPVDRLRHCSNCKLWNVFDCGQGQSNYYYYFFGPTYFLDSPFRQLLGGGFFTRNLLIRFLLQANNTSKSRVGMYNWEGRREGGKEGGFLPSRFHSGRKNSKGRNTTAQFG